VLFLDSIEGVAMSWTIGRKIGVGYGLALLLLALLGVVTYRMTSEVVSSANWTVHTYQVRDDLSRVLAELLQAEAAQRGYIIAGDDSYLELYDTAAGHVPQRIQALRVLTADNPNQQSRLDALTTTTRDRLGLLATGIQLRQSKGTDAAMHQVQTSNGRVLMDVARADVAAMDQEEQTLLDRRQKEFQTTLRSTGNLALYGVPLAIVLLGLAGWGITRGVTRQLRDAVARLGASSAEIVATTTQVAAGAAQTAAAVSEITATAEEVRQTAQLSTDKARAVAGLAQRTSQQSQAGRKSTDEAVTGMQQIRRQMESVATNMVRLGEQTQTIGQIIASVEDLATQSNLLAVNAAIEAARAGEEGKGFSVVAQEVRNLAEQSRQATTHVRTILGEIQKATTAAVMSTEQGSKAVDAGGRQAELAGEAIRGLSTSVEEASQAAMQIAASSQQQLVGAEQVAAAMASIRQASVQNEAGARQLEIAARDLDELGRRLGHMIES
jgi:methyl-accepting chemotaxis protein